MKLKELEHRGIVKELAELFHIQAEAEGLLAKAEINATVFHPFSAMSIQAWWKHVCQEISDGRVEQTLEDLLRAAADSHPGNLLFDDWRLPTSHPDQREDIGGSIVIHTPKNIDPTLLLEILTRAERMAGQGINFTLNMAQGGSSHLDIPYSRDTSPEDVDRFIAETRNFLAENGVEARITTTGRTFRDYYMDPLQAEGPDGQRFALEGTPASTRVEEVARGIVNTYTDAKWPMDWQGRQSAVADLISEDGGHSRLNPQDTLHDAGVRPGDTVRVAPERTAGAVDPRLREEALARVFGQVLDHAKANPGFEVDANAHTAPTEYLLRFLKPSFAPPARTGEQPYLIERHEVFVELPPDFPVKAPIAWWQNNIYHPNIDPKTHFVCLGALQRYYRPGLDFGDLCNMLVDMAGYRNYTLDEVLNGEAARWAITMEGLKAIHDIGGITAIHRILTDNTPSTHTFRIRKLDQ